MDAATAKQDSDQTIVLVLADIAPASRVWGWTRIVKGPNPWLAIDGVRFAKVLGSGYEGGFGLKPSSSRQGLFLVFHTAIAAADFLAHSEALNGYRERARELCIVQLRTWSCRGSWDGTSLDLTTEKPEVGPIAALTRASIHLRKASAFWNHAPPSQSAIESVQGVQLAVGLGEAPFLRQATFTVWDSLADMDAYARAGPHLEAIKAAAQNQYFSESMFARFTPISIEGRWKDRAYG
jgi:heme-degrading monooxygenase HmoA